MGANGRLGAALFREYSREASVVGLSHAQADLLKYEEIPALLSSFEFDLLINCAALTAVDYCEAHGDEAFRINGEAPGRLAAVCRERQAQMVHFSTDYVFDGRQRVPYTEDDQPRPLSIYGESKLAGEINVLQADERFLVVRTSWVFGPDRPSFIDQLIQRARQTAEVAAVADKFSTPTYTADVAEWLRVAWEKQITGLLHLANEGACSWQEYGQYALDCCRARGLDLKAAHVKALKLAEMTNFVAWRPVYSVLSTNKFTRLSGVQPRSWREAVAAYVKDSITRQLI